MTSTLPDFKTKHFSTIENDKLYSFSRSFFLRSERKPLGKKTRARGTLSDTFNFEIEREIFFLNVLTDCRLKNKAFKKQQAIEHDIERVFDGKYSARSEFVANLNLLQQTIKLNKEWCER